MKTYICLLYFIYSIKLHTVYALSCTICLNPRLEMCHRNSVPCAGDSNVCITFATNISGFTFTNSMLKRDCGRLSQCDLQGTMTSVATRLNFATTCCNTSSCTPPLPTYLPVTEKKNGLVCPASVSIRGIANTAEYNIECLEHETQCFTYSDVVSARNPSSFYLTGCASKNLSEIESLISRIKSCDVTISTSEAFPQDSLMPSFVQTCNFQHGKINMKSFGDLCLPDEDVCFSEHTLVADAGGVKKENLQRCGKSRQCDLFIAISHPNKTIITNTSCCKTQHCSPPTSDVSWEPGVENGVTCRSCYSAHSSDCDSYDTMSCTGIMDRCITYTQTLRIGQIKQTEVIIGCGTSDACTYGWSFAGSANQNVEVNITCTGTGNFIHNNILVLILLVSIIPVKLFYNGP
ncbi:uncharacterized protein [Dendropsophus ebraccatus]|uniref:uncharacterized protein n=1 Tax=Dendropsophus ebraccatus TaxID=150705 RepID=UPI00383100E0